MAGLAVQLTELQAELIAKLVAGEVVSVPSALPGPQLPYLNFYPSDFWGHPKVGAMGRIDHGRPQLGYFRLFTKSWQEECPCFLPNDTTYLAALAGCTPLDLQGDWRIVRERFRETEDGKYIYNLRLLKEYWKAALPYLKKVDAGRETARKKAEAKRNADSSASSSAARQHPPKLTQNQNLEPEEDQKHTYMGEPTLHGMPDYELLILKLVQVIPKGSQYESFEQIPFRDKVEAMDAIKKLSRARQIPEREAHEHILKRSQMYAACVTRWPAEKKYLSANLYDWFHESRFNRDESEWELKDGKPGPASASSAVGAGSARERHNISAASRAIQIDRQARGHHRGGDPAGGGDKGNG